MTFQQFKNLVDIGQIKQEPGDQKEFDGLLHSGRTQLKDSRMAALSLESRSDLAYNAAHALSLAWISLGKSLHRFSVSSAHDRCRP
jgi:hypothetical protein